MLLALATAEAILLPTPTSRGGGVHLLAGKARGKGKAKSKPGGGGFGAAPPKKAKPAPLDRDAQSLLDRANGDLDAAQGMMFQDGIAALQAADPALYAKMAAQQGGGALSADVHEKLVELTWDTVAAYMPATAAAAGGPSSTVAKKLDLVAACCCAEAGGAVLDVGCGDGSTLPFLRGAGADDARYCGLDLSGRMIAAARAAHPAATIEQAGFFGAALAAPPRRYDCVLFNGSLQFFGDQQAALARAAALLEPEGAARVVIAHVNGGAFVRDEAAGNPATVLSTMPSLDELAAIAPPGLEVRGPMALGAARGAASDAAALEQFYVAALVRP